MEPIISSIWEAVRADGIPVPPELFASTVLSEIEGSCARVALPETSENAGCVADGTPDVEIELIHLLDCRAKD